jgi:hypothetical protein
MVKVRALVLAGVAASLLVIPTSTAQAVPAPEGVTAQLVTINGTGCPDQVGDVTISPEGGTLNIEFSGFLATKRTRTCTAVVQVTAPEGYSYAVTRVSYSGLADLPEGSSGTIRTLTWFQGGSAVVESEQIEGPQFGVWDRTLEIQGEDQVFSSCGESPYLVLSTGARVSGSSSAQMSVDGSARASLDWATC